jgi:uncharacterized protein YciI
MRRLFGILPVLLFLSALDSPGVAATPATFFVRIHPARAGFLATMTPVEGQAMQRHLAYWKARMAEHKLILAGPVPINPGTFGILIIRAANLAEAEQLVQQDPSVVAHVTDYEIYPFNLALYEGSD